MAIKKLTMALGVIGALGLVAVQPVQAYSLSFVPSAANVTAGDILNVDVNIADAGTAVAAFDLFVGYDFGLLQPTGVNYGLFLGDPALFEALTSSDTTTPGVFEIAEVSLLSAADLYALQPPSLSSFNLATLSFVAQKDGSPTFGLIGNFNPVDDVNGNKLSVPEPSEVYLVGLGLALLVWMRKSHSNRMELGDQPGS